MGKWTKAKRDEHECDYPKFAVPNDTAIGDEWTCACGKVWVVRNVNKHPGDKRSLDQREHMDTYTAEFSLIQVPGGGRYND